MQNRVHSGEQDLTIDQAWYRETGSGEQQFLIAGEWYPLTSQQVLEATNYKRPDRGGVKSGTHYVVLRRRKVPAKWALRQALGLRGQGFQTKQAVAILRRIGFDVGQEP